MRVQGAATSRETIETSCDVVRSSKQKNPSRASEEGKKLAEAFHVSVLPHVSEERAELLGRRRRRRIRPEQGEPAWPCPGRSGDARAEAGSIHQSDSSLGRRRHRSEERRVGKEGT